MSGGGRIAVECHAAGMDTGSPVRALPRRRHREVPFVFQDRIALIGKGETKLADQTLAYWTNFAATGRRWRWGKRGCFWVEGRRETPAGTLANCLPPSPAECRAHLCLAVCSPRRPEQSRPGQPVPHPRARQVAGLYACQERLPCAGAAVAASFFGSVFFFFVVHVCSPLAFLFDPAEPDELPQLQLPGAAVRQVLGRPLRQGRGGGTGEGELKARTAVPCVSYECMLLFAL